jgi:hypothetical protein
MTDFPYLDGLERELVLAAASASRTLELRPGRAPRRRRGALSLIAAVVVLLGVTAAALAATGILTGSPVRASRPSLPRAGAGAPIASSARLLPISFPDPEGGLPWGVRSFRTTRGLTCLQVGRLYRGTVGALMNGRFRPFSLSLPSWPTKQESRQSGPLTIGGCLLPTETSAMEASNVPASAYVLSSRSGKRAATPKAAQVRWMAFGALGPSARSASYELEGHLHTVDVAPGSGAFLIVLPVGVYSEPLSTGMIAGGVSGGQGPINPGSPQGPVTHFTYDVRGHTCLVSRRGTNTCLPWLTHAPPVAPTRDLHQPIQVTAGPIRAGTASLLVNFRAPYAINSAESDYQVIAPAQCYPYGQSTDRDLKRGETVTVRLNYQPEGVRRLCGPKMRVQVSYTPSVREAPTMLSARGGIIVGEATVPASK